MRRIARPKRGKLFVFSGPSGAGKTTLAGCILKDRRLCRYLTRSVSMTTRPKRPGEKEGKDYFFVSHAEFRRLVRAKKILEWTRYLGYYYGTPKEFVDAALAEGTSILLCLDIRGAVAIKHIYPRDAVTVFILPDSFSTLEQRIIARQDNAGKGDIRRRLAEARREIKQQRRFDYRLVNDVLPEAVASLKKIVSRNISGGGGK
jgi:guanylate kinase